MNQSNVPVKVLKLRVQGPNAATRYTIKPAGCAVATELEPRGFIGNKCNTEVEANEIAGAGEMFVNNWYIKVEAVNGGGVVVAQANITLLSP